MQAFVRRSDLAKISDASVRVMASYDDSATITPTMRRPELALLTVAAEAMQTNQGMLELAKGWREASREQIIHGEAERRILAALPDHTQRNRLAEFMALMVAHGSDAVKWPKAAQGRKAEIERGWAYINAVRQAAKTMSNAPLPADPTADSLWPKRI